MATKTIPQISGKFDSAKELRKLKRISKSLPEDRRKVAEGLLADAAFMAEQLEQLRNDITENGWSEEYQNGANQHGRKQRVEADMYIKLQKGYTSIIKQLFDQLPKEAKTNDDLVEWTAG